MAEGLAKKIGEFARKVAGEVSYYTGIGWKYELDDNYRDFTSRKAQRGNVSPNNLIIRAIFYDN